MKKYFMFYEECILINGETNVAIYNLIDGNIYCFYGLQKNIISLLKKGKDLDYIIEETGIDALLLKSLISKLIEASLGAITEVTYNSIDLVMPPFWNEFIFFKSPIYLNRIFLVFGANCKKDCYFCKDNNYIRTGNCFGCYRTFMKNNIEKELLITFLKKMNMIGYNEINLIGGDIFDDLAFFDDILAQIRKTAVINIFWSGNDINENVMSILRSNDINLFIQKIYPFTEENKIDSLLKEINNAGITSNLIMIFSNEYDLQYLESIRFQYKKLVQNIFFDFAFHTDDYEKFKKYMIPEIPKTSIREYLHKRMYNSCLYGTIALQGNGVITVCPKSEKFKIGNIDELENTLHASNYNKFWKLTKEDIDGCGNCQFRYACNDCRFIHYKLTNNLKGMIENQECNGRNGGLYEFIYH